MNTSAQALPSIRNRSLLVALSFSKPQMSKLDRKATNDAEQANNAHGAIKAQKMLYPKHLIDPIVSKESEIREYLRRNTIEWGISGMFLLPTGRFMDVATQMGKYEVERAQLVTVFAQNWANVMQQAEQQQGSLFDPSVYPDVSDVVNQFTMHVQYLPVGDLGNGLFDTVEKDLKDAITQEVERTSQTILAEAQQQPLERLLDAVFNVYDKLSRDDSRIYESLMDELNSITALIPALNVTGDARLDALAEECREKLLVHVEHVKDKGSETRQRVAMEARAIINRLGVDPLDVQKLKTTERGQAARDAAAAILTGMKGIF